MGQQKVSLGPPKVQLDQPKVLWVCTEGSNFGTNAITRTKVSIPPYQMDDFASQQKHG